MRDEEVDYTTRDIEVVWRREDREVDVTFRGSEGFGFTLSNFEAFELRDSLKDVLVSLHYPHCRDGDCEGCLPAPSWEPCRSCRGSGLQDSMYGPIDCSACSGTGMVRCRDDHGRFS